MDNHLKSFFPTQPSANISHDGLQIDNVIVGGVSKREMFALEIFCAMLSNPMFREPTVKQLSALSIKEADRFLEALKEQPIPEEKPPVAPRPSAIITP